ncbi:Uncharacterised protein [Sebaldella termitidis]|uniref:Uncharacterized protein n=1 Tax=Sebaldella termitidis (strain ATCC 33386 / NCTC 11300) TaxID=526218 RepID=D1AS11_SEBTE|nr:hypothetical protein [Sebaldella termitidis]ACZ10998.1 hypothetical protein Sterm_4166 [Sebaldella termitidis ATCC 33386]SUI81150.1 Uncharacterised protein [Sebaldella termitidis]
MSLFEDLFFDDAYLAQKFSRKVLKHSDELKNDNEIIKKILIENMLDSLKNAEEIKNEIKILNDKISGMEKLLLEILESKK